MHYVDAFLFRRHRDRLELDGWEKIPLWIQNREIIRHLEDDERSVGRDAEPLKGASNERDLPHAKPGQDIARPSESKVRHIRDLVRVLVLLDDAGITVPALHAEPLAAPELPVPRAALGQDVSERRDGSVAALTPALLVTGPDALAPCFSMQVSTRVLAVGHLGLARPDTAFVGLRGRGRQDDHSESERIDDRSHQNTYSISNVGMTSARRPLSLRGTRALTATTPWSPSW